MSELLRWKRGKKLNIKTGKAEAGQRRVGNLLEGQANWKAYVLQIRQAFRVHSLWGTWPKSKWGIENPTTRQRQTERKNIHVSAEQHSWFRIKAKQGQQTALTQWWLLHMKRHKQGAAKEAEIIRVTANPAIWQGYWTKRVYPVFPRILKTRTNSERGRDQ